MPDTMKPIAKPARPDAKPPSSAAKRNSPRPKPSTARSIEKRTALGRDIHLEGRLRCPWSAMWYSAVQSIKAQQTSRPLLAKETVLGPTQPGERGDRRGPAETALVEFVLARNRI